jgi:DNA (cytosine-5)-methyltransferase 1
VKHRGRQTAGGSQLVLSVFPGIDLLGRGFESAGCCVVRGPDLIWGGDIRQFHPLAGRFDGVLGGSPCPDFSTARRCSPSGEGLELLGEFARVVKEARSTWWLLENVPRCPDIRIEGYSFQRLDIDPRDFGFQQSRLRHFQFGHASGSVLAITRPARSRKGGLPACLASKTGGRDFATFCELQGLPRDFDLPGLSVAAKYRAVGNGVHVGVAEALARAVLFPSRLLARVCRCGCGRPVAGRQLAAGAACRKRIERARRDSAGVDRFGPVTFAA